jgi:hypothetical protein
MPVQVMGRVIQPLVCAHAIAIALDLPAIHVILDGAELIMDHGSDLVPINSGKCSPSSNRIENYSYDNFKRDHGMTADDISE